MPARTPSPTRGGAGDNDDAAPLRLPDLHAAPRPFSTLPTYSERVEGVGAYNQRGLARVSHRVHVVDYSFMNLKHPMAAVKLEPRKGTLVKIKKKAASPTSTEPQVARTESKPDLNNILVFGSDNTGKTQVTQDGFVVMRAKEETYAFKENAAGKLIAKDKDMHRFELDADGNLVERKDFVEDEAAPADAQLFQCTSLRFDNNVFVANALNSLAYFAKKTLFKPELNLVHLDISCNGIEALPSPFPPWPLHTLLLHQNRIATLKQLNTLQALFGTLRKLTLNGNPVQEAERARYKFKVLFILPFLTNFDDNHVTPKDRDALATFEQIFVPKPQRGTTRRFLLPPVSPPPMSPSPSPVNALEAQGQGKSPSSPAKPRSLGDVIAQSRNSKK